METIENSSFALRNVQHCDHRTIRSRKCSKLLTHIYTLRHNHADLSIDFRMAIFIALHILFKILEWYWIPGSEMLWMHRQNFDWALRNMPSIIWICFVRIIHYNLRYKRYNMMAWRICCNAKAHRYCPRSLHISDSSVKHLMRNAFALVNYKVIHCYAYGIIDGWKQKHMIKSRGTLKRLEIGRRKVRYSIKKHRRPQQQYDVMQSSRMNET